MGRPEPGQGALDCVRMHPLRRGAILSFPPEKARCPLVTLIFRMFLSVKIDSNHPIRVGAGFFGIYANATRHHRARGCHARQLLRMQDSRSCPGSAILPIAAAAVSDLNFCTILKRVIGPPSIYGTSPRAKVRRRPMGAMRPAIESPYAYSSTAFQNPLGVDAPDA